MWNRLAIFTLASKGRNERYWSGTSKRRQYAYTAALPSHAKDKPCGHLPTSNASKMQPNWPGFRKLWRSRSARVILSTAPAIPLPTTPGPLHDLISATCEILSDEALEQVDAASALVAVESFALETLATVLNWLQLKPCHELHTASPSDLPNLLWYRLLRALELVTKLAVASDINTTLGKLKNTYAAQLQQPSGKERFYTSHS